MKKIYFLISAMLVMAACTSEDLFIDESNSTESALTRAALSNEYLDIKTTVHEELDKEDWDMVVKAISRLTIKTENGLNYIQESDVDELNMSKKLYNFIENSVVLGNELLLESDTTRHEAKLNISRVKTRGPESGGNTGTGHVCTFKDCVGHSIAYYLMLNVDEVNNRIAQHIPGYPYSCGVPCDKIESTLALFGNFTRQSEYYPANVTPPCMISGIILISGHALNASIIAKDAYGNHTLICYDDQYKQTRTYPVKGNQCATSPCSLSQDVFAYYK